MPWETKEEVRVLRAIGTPFWFVLGGGTPGDA